MARQKHLWLIQQGSSAWNAWREKNQETVPHLICALMPGAQLPGVNLMGAELPRANFHRANLLGANLSGATATGADLSQVELGGANLSHTVLTDATLSEANLTVAHLSGADLMHADLRGARLLEADLVGANLTGADLTGADLSGADLRGANLLRAKLDGTNLGLAVFSQTIFGAVDLRAARGLDTCRHQGCSFIDHETLISSGPLPLLFLRGCGLPDELIAYWATHPFQSRRQPNCRIEYAGADQSFAELLHTELQARGVRCWLAPQNEGNGSKFHGALREVSRPSEKSILVLSEASARTTWIAKHSRIRREQKTPGARKLFPVSIDSTANPSASDPRVGAGALGCVYDFQAWRESEPFRQAVEHLIAELSGPGHAPVHAANQESKGTVLNSSPASVVLPPSRPSVAGSVLAPLSARL